MKCVECSYHYKTDEDDFPCCQFRKIAPFDLAPCEYEDDEGVDNDVDEYGY